MSVSIDDFLKLRHALPVVDVRSPSEFNAAHIPGAFNVPLLNDEERVVVGTAYRHEGQRKAISEGFRLVGPRINEIIEATERIAPGKDILVHCWRGGMRSGNFCEFVKMAGIKSNLLLGGYKAYRTRAMASFQAPLKGILITGYTGSGKSEILRALADRGEQILDLENLAKHKGSAFGGLFMPEQPTTEQFQNELFEEILKLDFSRRVWIEDESLAIGKIFLPVDFWNNMKQSKMVMIDVAKDIRVARLVQEYGNAAPSVFLEIMGKLVKRLGGQHFNAAKENLVKGDMHSVISILLTYYDKAYQDGLDKRKAQIIERIEWDAADLRYITAQIALTHQHA